MLMIIIYIEWYVKKVFLCILSFFVFLCIRDVYVFDMKCSLICLIWI